MSVDPSRAKAIFLAAVEKPPAEREKCLEQACAGDIELLNRIRNLLLAHDESTGIFREPEKPVSGVLAETVDALPGSKPSPPPADTDLKGQLIGGRYKLLQKLGEGGMGEVWMAEQREPVKRLAAFKIIKTGRDTTQTLARFEAERQTLAMMDHPNIAKVLWNSR
jgi:hypothetical protein